MEVKIVLGYTFGDEGKGVTTQWLCRKAIEEGKKPVVVRFSGGPQAGHTVNNGSVEHVCSSFGSGVLLGVPTRLDSQVYVDPIALMREYDILRAKGFNPSISINDRCRIITPSDVLANRINGKVLKDGSCGMGIYPTYLRSFPNIFPTDTFKKACEFPGDILKRAAAFNIEVDASSYDSQFIEACNRLKELEQESRNGKVDVLIYEGSQGLLLDMDRGFFPNVTPSKTGLDGILDGYSFVDINNAEVYLVTRTYTTRHGNGYIPKRPLKWDLSNKHETNVNNRYQGAFKVGELELDLLNRASERHCLDVYKAKYNLKYNLVITHMDLAIQSNCFYCNNKEVFIKSSGTPQAVAEVVTDNLSLQMDNVYYNDSIYSNLREV